MLASATRSLAALSDRVLLVARHAGTFAHQEGSRYVPLEFDWDDAGFRQKLEDALARDAPIDRALLWLHQPVDILPWLLPLMANAAIVLVLGSMHGEVNSDALPRNVVPVWLGSKRTAEGRRWLTNEEISQGAIDALRSGRPTVVGEIE